ncbi:MAG: NAD(P)H-dependent glycerol-3-phosphate dehydrogenase [Bacilli bacterium]|jgi:glycerol-3-phosphate dehydrogenase (NAD(P)+)|nr:NAD(P)-dependent glycerol-3-phosphate dehydrogenase [Bacilli bacterium]
MNNRVTIIGAGSFGTAIAQIFADKKYVVKIYTKSREQAQEINEMKTNRYYFDDLIFTDQVEATTDLTTAINFSKYIILAVPSDAIRAVCCDINKVLKLPKIFINVAKGLEPGTNKLLSEIIDEEIEEKGRTGVVVLSGPSHAEEIVKRYFTALVAVSKNEALAKEVQYLFSNEYIRVYTSNDLVGVQVAATVKNILAIASGIIYGMGYGDNTRAALITRGLAEMVRYGRYKGVMLDTFFGLAGIGDLIVTATSYHSRNFQVGLKIGKGMSAQEALASSKTVVEGVRATEAVYQDIRQNNIDMPITVGVYQILFDNKDAKEVMDNIIKRQLKAEIIG